MTASDVLFAIAFLGLGLAVLQHLVLRRHRRERPGLPATLPGISVLKPLCGVDEGLEESLAAFATLDYPRYEVVLGVRDRRDAAWAIAEAAVARWPGTFRLVLQRGEPGLNPKVNQLVGMAEAARHDVLVVSDSNVRVAPGYLAEIAWHLQDEGVGLVTHAIAGEGEASLGARLETLHLTSTISPATVSAKGALGGDVVVGKSMAMRRRDLAAMGGFAAVKDVLAEDFVLGVRTSQVLGKRVVIAATPIRNVNHRRTVGQFLERYTRWSVMQRKIAGNLPYASQILLNPVVFAVAATLADPGAGSLVLLAAVSGAKVAVDAATGRVMRDGGLGWLPLLAPVKDLVAALAWLKGVTRNTVEWRGNRLIILDGSSLRRAEVPDWAPEASTGALGGPSMGPSAGAPAR
jgi:ceramide glucosyltransferase